MFKFNRDYKLLVGLADVTLVANKSSQNIAEFNVTVRRGATTHHASYTMDIQNLRKYGLVAECEHAKGLSSTCGGIKFTEIVSAVSKL